MPEFLKNPPLLESNLDPDPAGQLSLWLQEATAAGLKEPTAMALATADAQGHPSVRMVLFKGMDDGGLTFCTNLKSRKGTEIDANPWASVVFWWDVLERQVRVEGRLERLAPEADARHFYARPRQSQIAAITSRQSQPVASRDMLEQRFQSTAAALGDSTVPMPDFWGGYRLRPQCYEFWQGRRARLHDRLVYRLHNDVWRLERLEP